MTRAAHHAHSPSHDRGQINTENVIAVYGMLGIVPAQRGGSIEVSASWETWTICRRHSVTRWQMSPPANGPRRAVPETD